MNERKNWLWDKRVSIAKAKTILRDPRNARFLSFAGLLCSRKNTPREVFEEYLGPMEFLQNWNRIKRQMRKDSWNNPRIEFWQAIYEKIQEKYKAKGIMPAKNVSLLRPEDKFCKLIADKIKATRKQKRLTQQGLAMRLRVSQQLISRIETGRENISLVTLKAIVDSLGAKLSLEIS